MEVTSGSLFGHTSSIKEVSEGMLKLEFILFRKFFVLANKNIAPLAWWSVSHNHPHPSIAS